MLLGAVYFAAFPVTFNTGLRFPEASRGALMLASMPIWSALLGRAVGERLGRRQLVGVGLSLVGIGLAFAEPGWAAGGGTALLGDGLLLLTGLLGAVYGLLAKRALAVHRPATVTAYAMLFGWPGRHAAPEGGESRADAGLARPGPAGTLPRPTGKLPLGSPDPSACLAAGTF